MTIWKLHHGRWEAIFPRVSYQTILALRARKIVHFACIFFELVRRFWSPSRLPRVICTMTSYESRAIAVEEDGLFTYSAGIRREQRGPWADGHYNVLVSGDSMAKSQKTKKSKDKKVKGQKGQRTKSQKDKSQMAESQIS